MVYSSGWDAAGLAGARRRARREEPPPARRGRRPVGALRVAGPGQALVQVQVDKPAALHRHA
jgi:hypothetical protein